MGPSEYQKNTKSKSTETKIGVVEWLLKQKKISFQCLIAIIIISVSLTLCFYHLFSAYFGQVESITFRSTHLSLILVLTFLLRPMGRKNWSDKINWGLIIDLFFIVTTVVIEVYILWDFEAFANRASDATNLDAIMGFVLVIVVLEATRRAVGFPLFFLSAFFVIYTLYANYFPGIFEGPPTSYYMFFSNVLMEEQAIFGIPIMVMASYIVLFLVFGALLLRSGAGQFFLNLAFSLTGRQVGGPAKAAVISSMFMGSISGSSVANVVTTGSFTIPLMKQLGYEPKFAGAVEAVASSGGQFMPPVMGAAAFVIAAILGRTYLEVIIAATIPAILFYLSLFFIVHFEAKKLGLRSLPSEELPSLLETLRTGGHNLIALFVIISLIIIGYSVGMAAFWGIISIFILSFVSKKTRLTPLSLLMTFEDAAKVAIPVSIACAAAGLIIGAMTISGLGLRLSSMVIAISGGRLWLMLFLTMIMSLILGMGLPTTAVYVVVSALIAPILVQKGIVEMGAHLFAFYFGVTSNITPPVCLAAFAAAGVAKSNPMKTGYMAARIGIASYIVPFMFVYRPQLLMIGSFSEIISTIFISVIMIFCLASGILGWHFRKATILERCVFIGISIILIKSTNYLTYFLCISLVTAILLKACYHKIPLRKLSV